jgi:hypothetical protein
VEHCANDKTQHCGHTARQVQRAALKGTHFGGFHYTGVAALFIQFIDGPDLLRGRSLKGYLSISSL